MQRKAGHLSYELDSKAVRGLSARSFANSGGKWSRRHNSVLYFRSRPNCACPLVPVCASAEFAQAFQQKADFVRSFTDDPAIIAFSRFFCRGSGPFAVFCTAILYDCLVRQHSEVFDTYVSLFNVVEQLRHLRCSMAMASMRLVMAFFDRKVISADQDGAGLHVLQPDFIASVRARVHAFFDQLGLQEELEAYIETGRFPTDPQVQGVFSLMLVYLGIPKPRAYAATTWGRDQMSVVLLRKALHAAAVRDSTSVVQSQ